MTHPRHLTVREVGGGKAEITVEIRESGAVDAQPGGAFTTARLEDHLYRVTGQDGATSVVVVRDRDALWLFSNGSTWRVQVEANQDARRSSSAAPDHSLSAPMPATVVRVLVKAGQVVDQGEIVIVLEAMKMELSIRAPRAGTVAAIHCHEGDLVQPGLPLLDLE